VEGADIVTEHKSFKRLVRARMEKTGESYTAARAQLLVAADAPPGAAEQPAFPMSDDAIRQRTGRGWEEWLDLLDEWGAGERPHREIARWVAEQLTTEPLGWNAQAITLGYERARGGRAVGERADGFAVSASKTVAVPVDRLFDAFVDESSRARWLPDGDSLRARSASRPKAAHYDWGEGGSRVHVTLAPKDDGRSTVTVSHERLADAREAERMKGYWRERVAALKAELER
jgi:uncharacterized protein YndB with AHSA1/START domain